MDLLKAYNLKTTYKLIVHPSKEGGLTPFWGYKLEDEEGNEIRGITRATIVIEPSQASFPLISFTRKYQEAGSTDLKEETVSNVPVDICSKD